MLLTFTQNKIWQTPISFYNNILNYNSGTARVHNNLAMAYADQGDLQKAQTHYLKAIEVNDTYAETHYNLARLYLSAGQSGLATKHLERSLEINPNFFYAENLLNDSENFDFY